MENISVRDSLGVDTISRTTDAWNKLADIADSIDGEVRFDFRGVTLMEPWKNEDFKQFIKNERVYLKLYTASKTRDTIELLLAMGNLKTGRV